ncbi:MAG: amidohydrolase family protein [Verrucomicrobiaceae bacterium]|nr:amidohydrolase family protein [Verrucomicrobiaceae bacterium]
MRKLITTDSHWSPPIELADELTASYRELVPHLERRADGNYLVQPNFLAKMQDQNALMTAMQGMGRKVEPEETAKMLMAGHGDSNPSPYPKDRLREMARDGVVAEVLIGPEGFGHHMPGDADLAWCRLMNDWLADNYRDHLQQFAPSIQLPLNAGMDAVVNELQRAAALGLRPALLPDCLPDNPYYKPYWEPLWEAAAALNIPISMHISFGHTEKRHMDIWPGMTQTSLMWSSVAQNETICWLVFGGILERHPNLKIILTEGSAGWLSWLVEYMDYAYAGRFTQVAGPLTMIGGQLKLKELPSFYVKRQVACTFMFDPVAVKMRHTTGLDSLMWGNDYPHAEGIFPNSQDMVAMQFDGVPEAEIQQMTFGNAARIFGLGAA